MENYPIELPNHLSDLIDLALEDLESVEQMKDKYQVDMLEFHKYSSRLDKCLVCFAGAVMSQTLKIPINQTFYPANFKTPDIENKLLALNSVRLGAVNSALFYLGIVNKNTLYIDIVDYRSNKFLFKKQLKAISLTLKELSPTVEGLSKICKYDFYRIYEKNSSI